VERPPARQQVGTISRVKLLPRDSMFGMYRGERVMVIAVPDDVSDVNAECEVEYLSPLASVPKDTRARVRWGDVDPD